MKQTNNTISSIYTNETIKGYHVVKTVYRCTSCHRVQHGPLSRDVIVTYGTTSTEHRIALEDLLTRYGRIFENKTREQLWRFLPQFPIEVRTVYTNIGHCEYCLPAEIGNFGLSTRMPIEIPDYGHSLESPNKDFDQRARAQQRKQAHDPSKNTPPKRRTRYAKPSRRETPEQRDERKRKEHLSARAIAGDLDAFLKL